MMDVDLSVSERERERNGSKQYLSFVLPTSARQVFQMLVGIISSSEEGVDWVNLLVPVKSKKRTG